MENTSDSLMPRPLLLCLKSEKIVCYSVPDNTRHKNKALTRGQILGALWGMEFEGETRTVDAHVGRIRKKLDWGNVIKTIPTIGYRLEVDQ